MSNRHHAKEDCVGRRRQTGTAAVTLLGAALALSSPASAEDAGPSSEEDSVEESRWSDLHPVSETSADREAIARIAKSMFRGVSRFRAPVLRTNPDRPEPRLRRLRTREAVTRSTAEPRARTRDASAPKKAYVREPIDPVPPGATRNIPGLPQSATSPLTRPIDEKPRARPPKKSSPGLDLMLIALVALGLAILAIAHWQKGQRR